MARPTAETTPPAPPDLGALVAAVAICQRCGGTGRNELDGVSRALGVMPGRAHDETCLACKGAGVDPRREAARAALLAEVRRLGERVATAEADARGHLNGQLQLQDAVLGLHDAIDARVRERNEALARALAAEAARLEAERRLGAVAEEMQRQVRERSAAEAALSATREALRRLPEEVEHQAHRAVADALGEVVRQCGPLSQQVLKEAAGSLGAGVTVLGLRRHVERVAALAASPTESQQQQQQVSAAASGRPAPADVSGLAPGGAGVRAPKATMEDGA